MKILILTASAGNGHNSTAKRIREKVLQNNNTAEIKIVDTYKEYSSKLQAWIIEEGYFLACNKLLPFYNYFFKKTEKASEKNKKTNVHKNVRGLLHGIINEIYSFQPDLIISTYIFNTVALSDLKKHYEIPAKIMCMTLDYGISPYWEKGANTLDYMFLTGDYMIESFLEKGYKKEQLISSGIPVADQFANPIDRKKASEIVGLDPDMFTIVIMKASFFPIKNRRIISELKKVEKPLQIVIVNGNNPKEKRDLDRRIKKANLHHKIFNLGYTNKIAEYFSIAQLIVGKAGGLSTTETINAGIPSLIVDKLPQQEVYNKEHLIKNNCAISINKRNIAENINYLINNPAEYEKLRKNTLALRKPDTMDVFYNVIKDIPAADYSKIKKNQITKKELRKKVK